MDKNLCFLLHNYIFYVKINCNIMGRVYLNADLTEKFYDF